VNLRDEIAQEQPDRIEESRIRKQNSLLQSNNDRLTLRVEELERTLSIVEQVETKHIDPPSWLVPAKPKRSAATLVVMLSDTHLR